MWSVCGAETARLQAPHHRTDWLVLLPPGRVKLRSSCQQGDEPGVQLIVLHRSIEQLLENLHRYQYRETVARLPRRTRRKLCGRGVSPCRPGGCGRLLRLRGRGCSRTWAAAWNLQKDRSLVRLQRKINTSYVCSRLLRVVLTETSSYLQSNAWTSSPPPP